MHARVSGRGRYNRALPRAERQARQRQRLLDALATCSWEQGAANVSVTDVVSLAGAGRNTFYTHFDSIPSAYVELSRAACALVRERTAEAMKAVHTPVERLRVLAETWLASVREAPMTFAAALAQPDGPLEASLASELRAVLREAARDGLLPAAHDAPREAAMIAAASRLARWTIAEPDADTERVLTELMTRAFR